MSNYIQLPNHISFLQEINTDCLTQCSDHNLQNHEKMVTSFSFQFLYSVIMYRTALISIRDYYTECFRTTGSYRIYIVFLINLNLVLLQKKIIICFHYALQRMSHFYIITCEILQDAGDVLCCENYISIR